MIEKKEKRKTPKRMKEESSYDPKDLGDVLEREMGDMTRADFARKLGITRPTLDKYLSAVKGGVAPSCEAICLMADNLDCSVDYLLGRTRLRNPENAVALDELMFTDSVVSALQKMKEDDSISYCTLLILIQQPWFWEIVQAIQSLIVLKSVKFYQTENTSLLSNIKEETVNGQKGIFYTGDYALESVLHFIEDKFSASITGLTAGIAVLDGNGETLYKNYTNLLHGKKIPLRQNRSGKNKEA